MSILGATILAGSSLLGGAIANSTNKHLIREQLEYQKELNKLQMEREDNAYQRAVADAKLAGLSPLSVSSGASAGGYSSTSFSNVARDYISPAVQAGMAYQQMSNQNEYVKQQTQYIKDKLEWEKIHGFRGENPVTALTGIASKFFDTLIDPDNPNNKSFGEKMDKFGADFVSAMSSAVESTKDTFIRKPASWLQNKTLELMHSVGKKLGFSDEDISKFYNKFVVSPQYSSFQSSFLNAHGGGSSW